MILYPSELPADAKAFNFVSSKAYNPQNDIVLSVEYAISGHSLSEAGLSFFICSDSTFSGGMSGADLGYSGSLSGTNTGIGIAQVGIGIDSTGVFGLSAGSFSTATSSTTVWRDGLGENDIIPNSIAARAGTASEFSLSALGNYYRAISSFNIVGDNNVPKALRFRLGNVARTLYLDYKPTLNDLYQNVAAVNIGDILNVTPTSETWYKIGMGFTTPVNSSLSSNVANFYFKTVHLEGLVTTLSSIQPLVEVWENILPIWPDIGESWSF